MSNMSDYLEVNLLNLVFNQTAFPAPTSLQCALFDNVSGNTSTNLEANVKSDEISGTAYARETITTQLSTASGSGGLITNESTIQFATAGSGGWGTVTHAAILDQSNNVLVWALLSASKLVGDGDTFSFPSTDLDITFG